MPEIKHNFTGGKMNKDLDERLIPNGQYRDAMNIQVSTSEGSDVGTIQNILGTRQVSSTFNSYYAFPDTYGNPWYAPPAESPNSILSYSGSIADEKNDKLYYFLRGGPDIHPFFEKTHKEEWEWDWTSDDPKFSLTSNGIRIYSDHIIQYANEFAPGVINDTEEPVTIVATDNHTLVYPIYKIDGEWDFGFNVYGIGPPSGYQVNGLPIDTNEKSIMIPMDEVLANKFLVIGAEVGLWNINETSINLGKPFNIWDRKSIGGSDNRRIIVSVQEQAHSSTPFIYGSETIRIYKINLSKSANPLSSWYPHGPSEYFTFYSPALRFPRERTITGINIIDDMLLWTDGSSEPKKINIPRSIEGTSQTDPRINTKLVVEDGYITNYTGEHELIKEQHINVIKRKPAIAPYVNLKSSIREGQIHSVTTGIGHNFSDAGVLFQAGYQDEITLETGTSSVLNYIVGDDILLLNQETSDTTVAALPFTYDVKIVLIELISEALGGARKTFKFEILSISSFTPVSHQDYYAVLSEFASTIYENEMFRVAYRYRWEDGEYSAFSPFSSLCFVPGEFKYDNKNVFNAGMRNHISDVTIEDFADIERIKDVTDIDLLLKYEDSPNIYLIESLKRDKWISTPSSTGSFNGLYNFNLKNIRGVLPENQLLRTWDNVPKNALSQELIGNRLVYGNYKQGYNILNNVGDIDDFTLTVSKGSRKNPGGLVGSSSGLSIKSQRNYQVGLAWIDKEGRESPIITRDAALINFTKTDASGKNLLTVTAGGSVPDWAISYKYYVKDSSAPSYNIVMDTLYLAENGDFWLSFPSSERNKVEEGDYLELKKGMNISTGITEPLKEKIVAIENEAPEFIKTKHRSLGRAQLEYTGPFYTYVANNEPTVDGKGFKMWKYTWVEKTELFLGGGADLAAASLGPLVVMFEAEPVASLTKLKSQMYDVASITEYDSGLNGFITDAVYIVRLERPISENDNWIYGPGLGGALEPTLITQFFEKFTENKAEHEGRFFAKIHGHEKLLPSISSNNIDNEFEEVIAKALVGRFDSTTMLPAQNPAGGGYGSATWGIDSDAETAGLMWFDEDEKSILAWNVNANSSFFNSFPSDTVTNGNIPQYRWFIDGMNFVARQRKDITTERILVNNMVTAGNLWGWGQRGLFTATQQHVDTMQQYIDLETPGTPNWIVLGNHYLELSLTGVGPEWDSAGSGNEGSDAKELPFNSGYWFDTGYNPALVIGAQNDFISQFVPGARFRFQGTTETYTILQNPHVEWRYNYDDGDDWGGALGGSGSSVYDTFKIFSYPWNRRVTFLINVDKPIQDLSPDLLTSSFCNATNRKKNINFIATSLISDEENSLSTVNPAIWEVQEEPTPELDLYYEASKQIPIFINDNTNTLFAPVGSYVTCPAAPLAIPTDTVILGWGGMANNPYWPPDVVGGNWMELSTYIGDLSGVTVQDMIDNEIPIYFHTIDGGFVSTTIIDFKDVGGEQGKFIAVSQETIGNLAGLDWFNCISFRNGVESAFLKDDYNAISITKGVKVSSTINELYKEEHRKYGLIYSGLYNSTSGINNLNQFIAAEKITKDLNPTYGSIQKLHARDTDLVTLCEDKVLRILANKDAVYNADGNVQLTSTNNVLGQAVPFVGEFGISRNPESFVSESYRSYFTDKQRGAVLRLSKDGLTPISNHGMHDWFKDNLKLANKLIGTYDSRKNEYNVTLKDMIKPIFHEKTVSFREDVKGWVSFKSFIPDGGLSLANDYYTISNTALHKHHHEGEINIEGLLRSWPRNAFYYHTSTLSSGNFTSAESTFNVILNESPGSVKSFNTLNYEGTQSKIDRLTPSNSDGYNDNEYYNLQDKLGWHVDSIITNKQKGSLNEFIEKEGKWFNYIKGVDITTANNIPVIDSDGSSSFDVDSFAIQGIGMMSILPQITSVYGCMDPTMFNYNPDADYADNSCYPIILGCFDDSAFNYNDYDYDGEANAFTGDTSIDINTDDGSCIWYGCTDVNSINYNPQANVDDGSCIAIVYGCTDPTAFNYDAAANTDDGSCTPVIFGCLDATAANYNPLANTSDQSCVYWIYGCTDPTAFNYDSSATADDGSCCLNAGCTDPTAFNYDISACYDDGSCIATVPGCTDPAALNYNSSANFDDGSCIAVIEGCTDPAADNYDANANVDDGSCTFTFLGCTDSGANNYDPTANTNDGSCEYCNIPTNVQGVSSSNTSQITFTVLWTTNLPATVQSCDLRVRKVGTPQWTDYNILLQTTSPIWSYSPPPPPAEIWEPGETYEFRVRANCSDTDSNWSPVVQHTLSPLMSAVYGCMNNTPNNNGSVACNYNPNATVDDGSCEWLSCAGCTDPTYMEYCDTCYNGGPFTNSLPLGWSGGCNPYCPCTTLIQVGCTDPTMFNYDPNANVACGPPSDICCIPISPGCTDLDAYNYSNNYNVDCNEDPIVPFPGGDYSCCDYNGCMDPTAINYDSHATIQVNASDCCYIAGCTDPNATNFNLLACIDDGSCIPLLGGCTDPLADNYYSLAIIDDGSCLYGGCMDVMAFNYNPNANVDIGGCLYMGCMDNGTTLSGPNNDIPIVPLCLGNEACNYDPTATIDDGNQCLYCGDATSDNVDNYDGGSCGGGITECCLYCWGPDPLNNIPTPVISFQSLPIGQGGGYEVGISFQEAAVNAAVVDYYLLDGLALGGAIQITVNNSTGWGTGTIVYTIGTSDNTGNLPGLNLTANTSYNYFLGAYCANSETENDVFDEEFTTPS